MLFNVLSSHPDLWSLYRESQAIFDQHFPVKMITGSSEVVRASNINQGNSEAIERSFYDSVGNMGSAHMALSKGTSRLLRSRVGGTLLKVPVVSSFRLSSVYTRFGQGRKSPPLRIIEKTPENCFRIEALDRIFPDSQFIYLVRDPRQAIASIYSGWRDGLQFRRCEFPPDFNVRGYEGRSWCFGLIPQWERLNNSELIDVCAHQWLSYHDYCQQDLPSNPARVIQVRYEELASNPGRTLRQIAEWAELDWGPLSLFEAELPIVNTLTRPGAEKWRRIETEIEKITDLIRAAATGLGYSV